MRERERERQTDRQTDRDTETDKQVQRDRVRDRHRERGREGERYRQTGRQAARQTDRHRQTETETETQRGRTERESRYHASQRLHFWRVTDSTRQVSSFTYNTPPPPPPSPAPPLHPDLVCSRLTCSGSTLNSHTVAAAVCAVLLFHPLASTASHPKSYPLFH